MSAQLPRKLPALARNNLHWAIDAGASVFSVARVVPRPCGLVFAAGRNRVGEVTDSDRCTVSNTGSRVFPGDPAAA